MTKPRYAFAAVLALSCAGRGADDVREVHTYKSVDSRDLKLYVTVPPRRVERPSPAIVFFHGGGWTGGRPGQFDRHAAHFASRGMVAVQVEYRLLRPDGAEPPLICVQDAKSAMRWVRARSARFDIDPARIASAGGSAGGHLAAFCGMMDGLDDPRDDLSVPARSNAMILFNPVFDNGPDGYGHKLIGGRYPAYSPFHNVSASTPPAIVFVGSEDKLLPVATVTEFCEKSRRAGVRCEARVYDGQGHGFFNYRPNGENTYFSRTLEAADDFLVSLGWLPKRGGSPNR